MVLFCFVLFLFCFCGFGFLALFWFFFFFPFSLSFSISFFKAPDLGVLHLQPPQPPPSPPYSQHPLGVCPPRAAPPSRCRAPQAAPCSSAGGHGQGAGGQGLPPLLQSNTPGLPPLPGGGTHPSLAPPQAALGRGKRSNNEFRLEALLTRGRGGARSLLPPPSFYPARFWSQHCHSLLTLEMPPRGSWGSPCPPPAGVQGGGAQPRRLHVLQQRRDGGSVCSPREAIAPPTPPSPWPQGGVGGTGGGRGLCRAL